MAWKQMKLAPYSRLEMMDGFVVNVGERIEFSTKYGSDGFGIVAGFNIFHREPHIVLKDVEYTRTGPFDRWPLKAEFGGGFYDRLTDYGINGGEIVRPAGFVPRRSAQHTEAP